MNRICPNCNNNLADHEMYFCQNCGQKLDDELIADNAVFHVKESKVEASKKSFAWNFKFKQIHLNKKMLLAFALVLLAGVVSLGSILFLNMKAKEKELEQLASPPPVTETKIEYAHSFDLALEQPNIAFNKEELTDYVPFDVDFYLAGSNVSSSLELLWGENAQNALLNALSDYVKESFVVFGERVVEDDTESDTESGAGDSKWQTALVLYLSQEELPEEITAEIINRTDDEAENETENATGEDFLVRQIGNAIVITQYEPFFELVEESYKGTAKNVTHKPKYSSYKQELAPDGQLVFMNFSDDPAAAYNLFEAYGPSEELKSMLGELISEKYEKFVIRRK